MPDLVNGMADSGPVLDPVYAISPTSPYGVARSVSNNSQSVQEAAIISLGSTCQSFRPRKLDQRGCPHPPTERCALNSHLSAKALLTRRYQCSACANLASDMTSMFRYAKAG